MSDWQLPYMESESSDDYELTVEELENKLTVMKEVVDVLVETVQQNTGLTAASLILVSSVFSFGFGYGCYKWLRGKRSTRSETVIASETNQETSGNAAVNSSDDLETSELTNVVRKSFGFGYGCFQWLRKLVSSRSDTEPANDGTNSSSDAEAVELTNVKKSVAAGQTDSCIQEVDATDDEFLNRPRSPSPTVSEFTDVTPSRPRKPIARDLSESSATPQESTPPRRQKIVKTRCPPYRSLANKNRKSPVHNKSKTFKKA